ncbi:MAG: hypothetical protein WBQ79_07470 [Acidobacteriaceae bacterium]
MVKAERVGIAMMDISICRAIAPYNTLIGGKLVYPIQHGAQLEVPAVEEPLSNLWEMPCKVLSKGA